MSCSNCATLARVVQQQQAQIAILERIILTALGECNKTIKGADQVLKGNQPRGTWAYAKGQKETAETIARKLR